MQSDLPHADTRAAAAALARLPIIDASFERCLLIDDSEEDATQIILVITERTIPTHASCLEVQS